MNRDTAALVIDMSGTVDDAFEFSQEIIDGKLGGKYKDDLAAVHHLLQQAKDVLKPIAEDADDTLKVPF